MVRNSISARLPFAFTLSYVLGLALAGCYSPGGGFMPRAGGSTTYYSTEMMQKSITMVDTRTNEVFFTMDIPPGKQLVIDFDAGEGDNPVTTPDLLRWEVMDQGTMTGRLHNSKTVPNATSRRVDVTLHHGTTYANAPPELPLRTDQVRDRPEWWTPAGGPMPEDKRTKMYDN